MSCDSSSTKTQEAPKLEVSHASNTKGQISEISDKFFKLRLEDIETDPNCDWDQEQQPVSGDETDKKIDEIFSSSFLKDSPTETKVNLKLTKRQQRKLARIRLDASNPEKKVKQTRKVDIIKNKKTAITKTQLSHTTVQQFEPVYDDRRLFNADSFVDDVVIPVKIIDREISEFQNFKINNHYMARNHTDGSSFLYGKTVIKNFSDVEKFIPYISKTQAKRDRKFLSKSNFQYDLKGNKILIEQNKIMDPMTRHDQNEETVLQQETHFNSNESVNQPELTTQFSSTEEDKNGSTPFSKSSLKEDLNIDQLNVNENLQTMETNQSEETKSNSRVNERENFLNDTLTKVLEQLASLSKTVEQQTQQINELTKQLIEKDSIIQKLREDQLIDHHLESTNKVDPIITEPVKVQQPIEESTPVQTELPKQTQPKNKSDTKPSTSKPRPNFKRAKTAPVENFTDDGIRAELNIDAVTTSEKKIQVIKNNLSLSEEEKQRVVGQGTRSVNAEKVSEISFVDKLKKNLMRSKSFITYSAKEVKEKIPPRPKGIQERIWRLIVESTPETLEHWEAKRKIKVFDQYKKLFYAQRQRLEVKWQQATIKAKQPNLKNDWLMSPGKVLKLLKEQELSKVPDSLSQWRAQAANYVPKGSKIPANWSLNQVEEN